MMCRKNTYLLMALVVFFVFGCASAGPDRDVFQYPATENVTPIFQLNQALDSCRIFAHLFATMPANMTTSDFAESISGEAKSRGADMMLIGQSRQCTTETSLNYSYYGPDMEYKVKEWPGWSFGFSEWGEQGSWASIGYDEWMDSDVHYDYPLILQAVFLRCQP